MKHHRFLTALMSFTFFPSFLWAEVTFTKIGHPIWEPTGAFVSSLEVPQEPGLDPFENERLFFANVLGSSHVISESLGLGFLPSDTYAGPYDREFQEAVAAWGGSLTDVVSASDVRAPQWMFRGVTLVPSSDAPKGRSMHGDDVRVIPNDIFPITATYVEETRNGGRNLITKLEQEIPALDSYGEVTDFEGNVRDYTGLNWSRIHSPFGVTWRSTKPLDEIEGNYIASFRYLDAEENGWDVTFSYSARPATGIDGDLDYDRSLDLDDLYVMTRNVAVGSTSVRLNLNGDGRVDLDDVHFWVTDLKNTWVGDANLDGEFDSGDFVDVFAAGKYETGELALWSEGDWNADERFDSGDFVVAFQGGGYEMGARPAAAAVPEPSSWLLAILGMSFVTRLRKKS